MPDSPPYFEKDALTDKPARFLRDRRSFVRKSCYITEGNTYAVEVVVELFKEDDELIHIKALIIVERDTQKGDHHRASRASIEESRCYGPEGYRTFLRKEGVFGNVCQSGKRLA